MKAFVCGDVVPGCSARFVCQTDDDILSLVAEHASDAHGFASVPDELAAEVRSHITLAD